MTRRLESGVVCAQLVTRDEVDDLLPFLIPVDGKRVLGQRVLVDHAANVDCEVGEAGAGSRFLVELTHGELPAELLVAGMFAGDAVEPAPDAAGEQKIVLVNGQNAAFHDDAVEQPVGERQRHADRLAGGFVFDRFPAFQPVKGCGLLLALAADIRADGGVGQAIEGSAESPVMFAAGGAPDGF